LENHVPTRLTAREGRSFAFPVGGAFLVLGGILWWRQHPLAAGSLAGLGVTLFLAGLLAPTLLGPARRAWMGLAHAISRVTTPVFMGIVFYLVMTPIGLVRCLLGGNPLRHADQNESYWHAREEGSRRSDLQRQF